MASLVQKEDIVKMNELYLELKTYAAVARKVGFSPSTVKKYIIAGYQSQEQQEKNRKAFDLNIQTAIEVKEFLNHNPIDWTVFLQLTEQELEGCNELKKEFSI